MQNLPFNNFEYSNLSVLNGHVLLKVVMFVCYILNSYLFSSFLFGYMMLLVMQAADFYFVKNIAGKHLVKMRWYSAVLEDGKSEWRYENLRDGTNERDSMVFWNALYITFALWSLLAIFNLITLHLLWFVCCATGSLATAVNLLGFMRCSYGGSFVPQVSMVPLVGKYAQKTIDFAMERFKAKPDPEQIQPYIPFGQPQEDVLKDYSHPQFLQNWDAFEQTKNAIV